MQIINKQEKFSIRKYKGIGAASAVIGALFLVSGQVYASDENPTNTVNVVNNSVNEVGGGPLLIKKTIPLKKNLSIKVI